MNTIQNLFQQAQLAEAAYANFAKFADPKDALVDEGFSPTHAAAFVTEWTMVDQYNNSSWGGVVGTGFSATLFRNKAGQYSLAVRGSQDMADFIADTQLISSDGIAVTELVDMYNYWQRLTHTGAYDAVKLTPQSLASGFLTALYELGVADIPSALLNLFGGVSIPTSYDAARAFFISQGYVVEGGTVYKLEHDLSTNIYTDSRQTGLGVTGLTSVNVDGHSLGGHLAMAFSRLFPSATNQCTAVNGLGFKFADPNVNSLFTQLGGAPGFDAGMIQNVYGMAGPEFAAMNNGVLQQPGQLTGIYIESGGLGMIGGHSATQMTDSLALYNLLATLDPSLNDATQTNLDRLTGFLKASSYVAANSLEYTLDALRTMLQTDYTMGSANWVALPATTIDDRQSLYANLQSLQTYLAGSTFNLNPSDPQHPQYAFTLRTLTEAAGNSDLADVAKTDLATRYALYAGNTFVLQAAGTDLYTTINTNGALDLYDPAARTGHLTEQYLKDRAAFVLAKEKANTDDSLVLDIGLYPANTGWAKQGDEYVLYMDKQGSGLPDYATAQIYEGNQIDVVSNIKQIQFGSVMGDTLTGGNKADDLYGMWGDDTLEGGKGNDYLEGGKGNDTYVYTNGGTNQDGLDTILDTDGQGSIQIDGATITGGGQFGDYRVHRDAAGHLYADVGTGLVVNGNLYVQNWQAGNLGINMSSTAAADAIPATTKDINGDPLIHSATIPPGGEAANWTVTKKTINQSHTDDNGNLVVDTYDVEYFLKDGDGNPTEGGGPARADTLHGSAQNDHIVSGGGTDHIYAAQGGDDLVEAGGGDGVGTSNPTDRFSDYVETGAGADRIYANSYIDTATAITQGNNPQANRTYYGLAALGGAGNDVMVGSTGNDYLAGGTGSDLLIGAAGNDVIEGDLGTNIFHVLEDKEAANDFEWRSAA